MRGLLVLALAGTSMLALANHSIVGKWKWAQHGMTWYASYTSDGHYVESTSGSLPAFHNSGTYTFQGNTLHLHMTFHEVKVGGKDIKEHVDQRSTETVTWKDYNHIVLHWTGDKSPPLARQH